MITLQKRLSYEFRQGRLLIRALTHKSYHNERPDESEGHNERLEFLGDAVLDLSLSTLLMNAYPEFAEGELSKIRASLVNESTLAEISSDLDVADILRLGKGELASGGSTKPRLLASALEAMIGGVYLDSNFEQAHAVVAEIFKDRITDLSSQSVFKGDYKTALQEVSQERFKQTPLYQVTSDEGPDHDKIFYIEVIVDEKVLASGKGRNKKAAEQDAARQALEVLDGE